MDTQGNDLTEIEPLPDFIGQQTEWASVDAAPRSSKGPEGVMGLAAVGGTDMHDEIPLGLSGPGKVLGGPSL